jgi:hypothetical protein
VGTGNIRSYWQFLTNGDLRHTVGGTGNVIAKNLLLGNVFTGQFNGNIVAGNGSLGIGNVTLSGGIFTGNAAGLTNIPGANVSGAVANATFALDAGNANIANIAYSVDGANVTGTVANATFALDAGNANIANIAYSVDGANVSGTVANATFALDAGNANIANIAYSVDAANVSGLGNIATINLDGNVSNLLTGNGTFVAIPTDVANANYANFAGTVLTNAQPNITSVGTLTALAANTSTPINITSSNGNIEFTVTNSSNAAGRRVAFTYVNPVTQQLNALGSDEAGFGYYIANTTPGNAFPTNIKSYWQFLTNGNLQHTIGGTGAIVAKQGVFGTGNVSAGNVTAIANVSGNNVTATANIRGANVIANADVSGINFFATGSMNARNGVYTGVNGGAIQTNIDNVVNCPDVTFNRYDNNAATNNYSVYRARGTVASPASVVPGDVLFSTYNSAYSNVGFEYAATSLYNTVVDTNDGAGNITVTSTYSAAVPTGSTFNINYGELATTGNISATGTLDYLRTFGSFTSNVTQTNSNVGNAVYMTLNNDEGSNGVSIASSTQITTARTGLYNLQFSAQLEKTDAGTDSVEVWLTKNGSAVANSATRLQIQGSSEKDVAAWNWLVDSANVNDYYEIAWASIDSNMQIVAIDSANTLSGVAIPSLIVTVVPVGA